MQLPSRIKRYLDDVDRTVDDLGKPVDDGIKLSVAVLLAHGFVTTASCAGHAERRTTGPYIWIESRESVDLARKAVQSQTSDSARNDLFKKMKVYNMRERARISSFLAEFYSSRKVAFLIMITPQDRALGRTRLACIGSEIVDSIEDSAARKRFLKLAQAEFVALTNFLIMKL